MKKSFSLLEVLLTIFLIILIGNFFIIKKEDNSLDLAINRILLYLKQTRYQAWIDEKDQRNNPLWHKKRWTLKFFRCKKDVGGIYYSIYSDTNMTGHPSLNESLIDPLTNKKVYSSNRCISNKNSSKYVLLTKEFGIDKVEISCNNTKSLGQISFGSDGRVYTKLSSHENKNFEYELQKRCKIRVKSGKQGSKWIIIEGGTGYVYLGKSKNSKI